MKINRLISRAGPRWQQCSKRMLVAAAMSTAHAADGDDAVRALTLPTNTVEAGVGYVTENSFKFGQYNGLFDKGPYGIFNFDWRGGPDTTPTTDSAVRWHLLGTNLVLDTRTAVRGLRRPGQVQDLWRLTTSCAATTRRRHVPDAIPRRREQFSDPAQELDQADRSAGEHLRGKFSWAVADDGPRQCARWRRCHPADRGAAGDRQQHHRQRRSGFSECRPGHRTQDLRGWAHLRPWPAVAVSGQRQPDRPEWPQAARNAEPVARAPSRRSIRSRSIRPRTSTTSA